MSGRKRNDEEKRRRRPKNLMYVRFRPDHADDDPLFDLNDYVPPGGGLPEHLKGKSAEEVAQYYSGQLKVTAEKADAKIASAPPKKSETPKGPVPLTDADVAPAMGTMIQSAKMVAKASLDSDGQKLWDRFGKDVSDIMAAGFKGVQLADAQNWIFAYNQVLGSKATLLMKESREAEVARRTAETTTPGPHEEPKDIVLDAVQTTVAEGLGIGKAGYTEGIKIMREDRWPLTFSNRP
jgi:hypothetical protein